MQIIRGPRRKLPVRLKLQGRHYSCTMTVCGTRVGPACWPLPRRGKLPCAHMELRGQGWGLLKTTLDSLGSYPTARTSEILDVDACNGAAPPTRHDGHACENAPSDHTYTRYVNTNFTPRRKAMSLPPMTASGTPSAVPPKFIARGVVPIPPGEAMADLAPWLLGRRCWFHRGVAFQKGDEALRQIVHARLEDFCAIALLAHTLRLEDC